MSTTLWFYHFYISLIFPIFFYIWTITQIHKDFPLADECNVPFTCSRECAAVPVGNPVRGVLGAHSVSTAAAVSARLTACNNQREWLRGLSTAITATEPASPVHPLRSALCSQPVSVPLLLLQLWRGGWFKKKSTLTAARFPSGLHAEHMK